MDLIRCFLMNKQRSFDVVFLIVALGLCFISETYCFDSLDPNGNITIRWDVFSEDGEATQTVKLAIINYQLFRHIEYPGWKLSWDWPGDEVIWSVSGAETTEQGNCSKFRGHTLPHCCLKQPVLIDLLPGAPYNQQVSNCCKGGVLSSIMQDQPKYLAGLQMSIGNSNGSMPGIPSNFSLGVRGYTCGDPRKVPPTKFFEDQGRRKTQAVATWNITCTYSQFQASSTPTCCVELSAFYNETIVPCPKCSCSCREQAGSTCVENGDSASALMRLQQHNDEPPKPVLRCTDNMCPVKVHWHVKQSYTEYWRVKITITNNNYVRNYSDWSLVVLHPNLRNITQVFSFNYKPLNIYGNINDTGMLYGIQYYNDMLLQAGKMGNVQTELLMHKDADFFTFRQGWAFPRKISFNGDECVMPRPDDFPRLPNTAPNFHGSSPLLIFSLIFLFILLTVS